MYALPGTWYLPLAGTPCASCGLPATRLTVFAIERVITHQDDDAAPCHLSNPTLVGPDELIIAPEHRRAA
ncbi:MAG TPA: hypothetical protein VHZ97_30600 [Pseudonocardiaceae bacterium]|jgi:hypothetical protein|nr:hypothetical protein [Pseudonocardiaceae bacterium]